MTTQLSPLPVFKAWDNAGVPLNGGKLFTYIAGSTTKQASFTDSTGGTPNTNPVILNYRGEANVWLDPTKVYKVVLAPANDTDPPTNPFWTVDQISGGQLSPSGSIIPTVNNLFTLGNSSFSWANAYFGANGLALIDAGGNAGFYARTAAEIAASVTPTDYFYPEGDLRRYGGDPTGVIDASTAWQSAITVGIARLAKGCSYKIVTQATKTGQVTILGEGKSSKILSDSIVLTATNPTGSIADNFWMENITAPWIITRNPANWSSPPFATLQQSNTVLGYQPTVNDSDVWAANQFQASQAAAGFAMVVTSVGVGGVFIGATLTGTGVTAGTFITSFVSGINGGAGTYTVSNTTGFSATTVTTAALTAPQQNQNIGPAIVFTGLSTDIEVSRIYGRFARIDVLDSQYSTVRDCDFRGGKGVWGGINIDNATNGLIFGKGNKAIGNSIRYASFSGIIFQNNDGGVADANITNLNGESGLKMAVGNLRNVAVGNHCDQNYYDGLDMVVNFPSDDTLPSWHTITGNSAYQNGGDGLHICGRYNVIVGNHLSSNNRFGIASSAALSKISGNFLYDNNTARNVSVPELLGGSFGNSITGNQIFSGAGQTSNAIFVDQSTLNFIADNYAVGSTFFFGNPGVRASITNGNVDPTVPALTYQSFVLSISNNGTVIQHAWFQDPGTGALGDSISRILNASSGNTVTPTGPDASTAFAGGGKISSVDTNTFICDTNAQVPATAQMVATCIHNESGTAILIRALFKSYNVNGVTRLRLVIDFDNATTGAAFAITPANIASGKTVQVQFLGKLG